MLKTTLTAVNSYTLAGPADGFTAATVALAARVEAEGHPGVLSYRFFVNAAEGTARAVVDYANADAWIGHHEIAMAWPEMKALHAAATLSDVTFLGALTAEIRDWLRASALKARIHEGHIFAAGFSRN